MNAMTEIPPELANTIIAIIIYFAATSILIERMVNKFMKNKNSKNTNKPMDAPAAGKGEL